MTNVTHLFSDSAKAPLWGRQSTLWDSELSQYKVVVEVMHHLRSAEHHQYELEPRPGTSHWSAELIHYLRAHAN